MKINILFAFRNILKRPFLNLVKVIGLSLALSSIIVIALFLNFEMSYDRSHKKSNSIYRFTVTNPNFFNGEHFARTHNVSYIPALKEYFPEVENYTRLLPIRGNVLMRDNIFVNFNQAFECDSTFFKVFNAELTTGNTHTVLNTPGSMVISESFARKVLGNTNPVGQVLSIPPGQYYGKKYDYTVKGVMKDFPKNSHFHPDIIASALEEEYKGWAWTYLLLSENAEPGNIEARFSNFYATHVKQSQEKITVQAHLQKITDIHLHSDKLREIEPNSNMFVIYTLIITIIILLLISLTNYANLNIGMTQFTGKYHFISKVSGASYFMKIKYLFTESIILILSALIISTLFTISTHFIIQQYVGINLLSGNLFLVFVIVVIFSMIIIITGIFPLLKTPSNSGKQTINKGLIVLQYAISIILIATTIVIYMQTQYALKNSIGGTSNNLVCFEGVHANIQNKFEVFKEELLKYSSIKSVSASLEEPGGEINDRFRFKMEGFIPDETLNDDLSIRILPCDYSFASIFNLKFLSGSNFSDKNVDTEGYGEYIINKAAMKYFLYSNPEEIIDKNFKLIWHSGDITIPSGKIIGVVENFHFSSLKKEIEPLILFKRDNLWLRNLIVSFQPGMKKKGMNDIKKTWDVMFPEYPFQHKNISSMFRNVYKAELLQSKLLSVFTAIALFICSMGLLGLTLLSILQRTKEIGVRKVNGANTGEILTMLNVDLIKWIIISSLLAIPTAHLAMTKWLENFAYKIELSWWIFVLAGVIALVIALLTVSWQSWRAANKNPVEALRYE